MIGWQRNNTHEVRTLGQEKHLCQHRTVVFLQRQAAASGLVCHDWDEEDGNAPATGAFGAAKKVLPGVSHGGFAFFTY